MNWGTKIVIGMILAMTAVVSAGIYMVSHDTDTLEENDYYEQGLSYDISYKKKENVVRYQSKAMISLVKDSLIISFAEHSNDGVVYLKRPSDRFMDRKVPFSTLNSTFQKIPVHELSKGVWHIKLEWEHAGIPYLQEQDLYIQ